MAGTVGTHQVAAFTGPVFEAKPISSALVKGNDDSNRTQVNAHDSDATIHVQSSTLAARPAAGTAQRLWYTTDGRRFYIDNGVAWEEVVYFLAAGGTITGAVVISAGGIAVTGNSSVVGTLTVSTLTSTVGVIATGGLVVSAGQASLARVNGGDSGAALALDLDDGNVQRTKLTANCTLTLSNPAVGASYLVELLQDATGSRTVTWPATVKWEGGVTPTLTTTANRKDVFILLWNGTNYLGVIFGQNFADTV